MDINCDMGEGIGNEAALMSYIDSANIACGFHAGDAATMREVILLCLKYNVNIGAHPSFPDRENFGRTLMQLPEPEVYDLVMTQLSGINDIARECGGKLHHVKPHGALYNMAAKNAVLAKTIAEAVKDFDVALVYYGLSGSVMIEEAKKAGLQTAQEVFADRTYQADGSLTPRSQGNALLADSPAVIKQVSKIIKEKKVNTIDGGEISIQADTICIHGDGQHAVEFAKAIYKLVHGQ
jgi:UPF0271 protein